MRSWGLLFGLMLAACGDKDADGTDTSDETGGSADDGDGDGIPTALDCDDTDASTYPGATELCDDIDNDCDGVVDEGYDSDGDGVKTCQGDCVDSDPSISPLAAEISYDGIDQDCSGADEDDLDGDGYPAREAGGTDCDDTDPAVYPGVEEIPYDGIDQDCARGDLNDLDGDGVIGAAAGGEDCDDTDASVFPGNPELDLGTDGIDNDCDGEDGTTFSMGDAPISVLGMINSYGYSSLTGNSMITCDVDGDALADLVVAVPFGGYYAGAVSIWLGAEQASWSTDMNPYSGADIVIEDPGVATAGTMFLGFGLVCGDFNGDGAQDLGVGRGEISYSSTTYNSDFSVYLFFGGTIWDSSLSSADADVELVYELGVPSGQPTVISPDLRALDLDGDGVDELVVDMDPTYTSSGVVYQMTNADGLLWRLDLADAVGQNLDMADVVAGKLTPAGDGTVTDLQILPDLGGDGLPDVLVGQGLYVDEDADLVAGHLGWLDSATSGDLTDSADASLVGNDEDELGYRSLLGDFDGDGNTDLLVSAILRDNGSTTNAGALYLISDFAVGLTGTAGDPEVVADAWLLGEDTSGLLGTRLASMGDINGDGAEDVLVVALYGAGSGTVRLLSGAALTGTGTSIEDATLLRWEGEVWSAVSGRFGAGLEVADFDGDGVLDFALSDPYADVSGLAYVWLLGELGL